jgi:hypothetical protein
LQGLTRDWLARAEVAGSAPLTAFLWCGLAEMLPASDHGILPATAPSETKNLRGGQRAVLSAADKREPLPAIGRGVGRGRGTK